MYVFYSNFDQESSLDAELNSTSNEYALDILLMDPTTLKTRNTRKNMMMTSSSHFFQVFLAFGVACPVKSILSGYSLDAKFNFASNDLSPSNFE